MRRFYKLVTVSDFSGGYGIHLDGKPIKTPSGKALACKSQDLAYALQAEWAAQEGSIKPDTMPLTQILSTQIDQVSEQRAVMTTEVMKYLNTDLLCYRAAETTGAAQAAAWDPWLEWFEKRFGTALQTTTSLVALAQPSAAHEAVKKAVSAMDDAQFTILQILVPLSGSLVLGLAFTEEAIDPKALFSAIRVEENIKAELYNEDFYGPDPAQSKKDAAIKKDLEAAARFLQL
jgi:chaperone required for assembly of F1-ATPase